MTPYPPVRSVEPVSSILEDVYHEIHGRKSQNWQHCDVQFRGLCGQKPRSTREVCRYWKPSIHQRVLYLSSLCVIFLVDRHLYRYGLTHFWSHAASYSCFFRLDVPVLNVCPGSYFRWLQLQHRSGLTCVCVAAVFCRVAHFVKQLPFGSIGLQSHLVEVCLEPWLAVVETWGRWSQKEVGSAEDYNLSYKSKWNEWQPTCTFNSNWILLHIGALCVAARDFNGRAIPVWRFDVVSLFPGIHGDEWQSVSHIW
jgi:hypothetical protein